jgi:hypothetical protein
LRRRGGGGRLECQQRRIERNGAGDRAVGHAHDGAERIAWLAFDAEDLEAFGGFVRLDDDAFIGRFLTEPKRDVWFDRPPRLARGRFVAQACRRGLELDRRTRMAWRGTRVFVNAESTEPTAAARSWLRRLADRRALSAVQCQQALADAGLADILHGWYTSGWLALGPPTVRG